MRGLTSATDAYEDESSGAFRACPRQPDPTDGRSLAGGFPAWPRLGQHVKRPKIRWHEWRSYGI